jgi:hypothetical protein
MAWRFHSSALQIIVSFLPFGDKIRTIACDISIYHVFRSWLDSIATLEARDRIWQQHQDKKINDLFAASEKISKEYYFHHLRKHRDQLENGWQAMKCTQSDGMISTQSLLEKAKHTKSRVQFAQRGPNSLKISPFYFSFDTITLHLEHARMELPIEVTLMIGGTIIFCTKDMRRLKTLCGVIDSSDSPLICTLWFGGICLIVLQYFETTLSIKYPGSMELWGDRYSLTSMVPTFEQSLAQEIQSSFMIIQPGRNEINLGDHLCHFLLCGLCICGVDLSNMTGMEIRLDGQVLYTQSIGPLCSKILIQTDARGEYIWLSPSTPGIAEQTNIFSTSWCNEAILIIHASKLIESIYLLGVGRNTYRAQNGLGGMAYSN